jgi:EamA domain-containing membrane protein RarD
METTHHRILGDKLVIGIALIAVGIAGFLGALDIFHIRDIWRLWPLVLIVIGLANEAEAIRNRRSDGGWVLLAVGTWFLVGNFHLFGLSHGRAMPIAVVVAGASMALHAVIDRPAAAARTTSDSEENHGGVQ